MSVETGYAHPCGEFFEGRNGELPLRANPHMHLLEAALDWLVIDRNPIWRDVANEIATLCLERFIDRDTGALRELFASDWKPLSGMKGEILEPGHHYEWAFLLGRWADLTEREGPTLASKLIAFADRDGIDERRGVAVNAIRLSGGVHDAVARLWPQTERLRAYVIEPRGEYDARLHEAIVSLWRYLDTPMAGLWYENLDVHGRFLIEAAPATSFYHVVGVITELWTFYGAHSVRATQSD